MKTPILFLLIAAGFPAFAVETDGRELASLVLPTEGCEPAALQARVSRNRAELAAAVAAGEAYWATLTPVARIRWQEKLGWKIWAPAILRSEKINDMALERYSSTVYGVDRTLNEPVFEALRLAFENYLVTQKSLSNRAFCDEFQARYSLLNQTLRGTPFDSQTLSDLVVWFAATDQLPQGRAMIGSHFAKPSFVLKAKSDLLAQRGTDRAQKMVKTKFDRELNEKTTIRGSSETTTDLKLTPFSTSEGLRVKIEVQGKWLSKDFQIVRNVSTILRAEGTGSLSATSEIFFKNGKAQFTEPLVNAAVELDLLDVDADSTAVNLVARARFIKTKPDIEAQTSAGIAKEFTSGFRDQLTAMTAKMHKQSTEMYAFASGLGIRVQASKGEVIDGAIAVGSSSRPLGMLSASGTVSRKLSVAEDMSLSLHDSALFSWSRGMLGGAQWQDLDFAFAQRELTGSIEPEIRVGAFAERWSAQWNWLTPFRTRTNASQISYLLRFDRFQIDGRKYEFPFEVQADFSPRATDYGIELNRLGNTRVRALSLTSLDPSAMDFLQRKFGDFLPSVLHGDTLSFPGGGNFHALSHYAISSIEMENGWFHFGVKPR